MIGVLGEMVSAGLDRGTARQARELLAGAVEWLLGQSLPPGSSSRFPCPVAPGVDSAPDTRLAWCHGDVGAALALLGAARAAGEPEWECQALSAARAATARPRDQGGVYDGGLCHGAAGLAHLYNRLFHATGDPLFKVEAIAWIERLLAQRQPGRGVAGWLSWQAVSEFADRNLGAGWMEVSMPGFLTGAAGIGLTLLGAVSPVEPAWDRLLLCSVPSAAELEWAGEDGESQVVPADVHPCSWFKPRTLPPGATPEKGDPQ